MHLPRPSEGGAFTPVPAGNHPAICYRFIDLGTQEEKYYETGEVKRLHKIELTFEIKSDECRMDDGRPMIISAKYTWSMHEKAKLRLMLEAWCNRKFVDSDFGPTGWNIKDVLGKKGMVNVIHKPMRNGGTWAEISSVTAFNPKTMQPLAPLENTIVYFALDENFEALEFAKLPERIQERIKLSPEYKAIMTGGGEAPRDQFGGMDEEVPF